MKVSTQTLNQYSTLGFSLIPLHKNSKLPLRRWKANQSRRNEFKSVQEWQRQGFNSGIVCGKLSRLIAIDLDDMKQFEMITDEIGETVETTKVRTPSGLHFYFRYNDTIPSTNNFLNSGIELKSDGCYIVCPNSRYHGKEYKFITPLSEILPFPERFIMPPKKLKEEIKFPRYRSQGTSCIKQILEEELEPGQRDLSLYILFNLLCQNRNNQDHARKIVTLKNTSLLHPLSLKELDYVWRKRYNHSCHYVRDHLKFIECDDCRNFKRRVSGMEQTEKCLSVEHFYKLGSLSPAAHKVLKLYEIVFDKKMPSIRKMSHRGNMDTRIVKRAIAEMEKKGFEFD